MNKKAKVKNYTLDDLKRCIEDIKERKISLADAARLHQIPKSTIFTRVKNRVAVDAKRGPSSILSPNQEESILKWIFFCCDRGFPVTKDLLLNSVKRYITDRNIETPFKDNRPGRHWYEAFQKRHPEMSPRMAQNLKTCRALATRESLRTWFVETEKLLFAENLKDIDPSRIINLDESVFFPCPNVGYDLARKEAQSVRKVASENNPESISVLFTVTAAGEMAPPLIMFSYQRLPSAIARKIPDEWSIGKTENGWMTSESFYEHVTNVLYPWAVKRGTEFPLIIYLDGHSTHVTYSLVEFCKEKNIVLISLFPNATHLLQPLDVTFFQPLKVSWKKTLDDYEVEHGCKQFKKENFAPILKKAVDKMPIVEIVKNGFATCGLCPFSPEVFNYDAVKTNANNHQQQQSTAAHKYHLQYFEETILKSSMLNDFQNGIIRNMKSYGLFEAWQKMKRLSGDLVADIPVAMVKEEVFEDELEAKQESYEMEDELEPKQESYEMEDVDIKEIVLFSPFNSDE